MNLSWKRTLRTASSDRFAGHCVGHSPATDGADATSNFHLTAETLPTIVNSTTPATPLHDAHQAGYFFCHQAAR